MERADPAALTSRNAADGPPASGEAPARRLERLGAGAAALILFLIPLWRFLRVAAARFDYPFDLEWVEGGVLLHAQRLLTGHSLYAAPSLDFIPFMYTPGYYALVAAVLRLGGSGYAAARLCSIAATLGTGALVAWTARRAGNPAPLALAWAGLWFASFSLSGFFFDLARVDAVLTFVLMGAMAVLLEDVRRPRRATFALLVLLAVLAVLVKQNTVVFCAALAAGLAAASGWRRGAAFAAWTAGALALVVLALQAGSDGWFWFYTVSVPRSHGVEWSSLVDAARAAGLGGLPIAWLALPGLAALARAGGPPPVWRALALLLAAAFAADLGMTGHQWSFDNVHMPLHATLVLAVAVTAPALLAAIGSRRGAVPAWLVVGLALQVWATGFDAAGQIPPRPAREASQRVVRRLAALAASAESRGGRILAPEFPYLLAQAGLRPCFHAAALSDLLYASRHGLAVDLSGLLPTARSGLAGYLRGELRLPPLLAPAFDRSRAAPLGDDAEGWPPLVGMHDRPQRLVPGRGVQLAVGTPRVTDP